jgi:hypothetical protein
MDNENNRHFPFGRKSAEGFCPPIDHSNPPNDLPPPLRGDAPMSMTPHDAGPRMPVHIQPDARRPRGEPAEIKPPHNKGPHDHLDPRWRR